MVVQTKSELFQALCELLIFHDEESRRSQVKYVKYASTIEESVSTHFSKEIQIDLSAV